MKCLYFSLYPPLLFLHRYFLLVVVKSKLWGTKKREARLEGNSMCEERRDFPRYQTNALEYLRKENGEKVVVLVASDESQPDENEPK